MALIKCPDCSKLISELSDKCIHCGRPMKKSKESIQAEIQTLYRENDAIDETYAELQSYYNRPDVDAPYGWWNGLINRQEEIRLKIEELKSKL